MLNGCFISYCSLLAYILRLASTMQIYTIILTRQNKKKTPSGLGTDCTNTLCITIDAPLFNDCSTMVHR